MENVNQEANERFQKNNGMTIEEAYRHVEEWFKQGQYGEVVDGCEEILRYVHDYAQIKYLLEESKEKLRTQTTGQTFPTPSPVPQQTTLTEAEKELKAVQKQEGVVEKLTTDEKMLAAIGYIGFLAILPLLLKRNSDYCQFHGKQALVLAIVFFLYKYLSIFAFIPVIGTLIAIILNFGLLIEICVIVWMIIQAYRGSKWQIPIVYNMSERLTF